MNEPLAPAPGKRGELALRLMSAAVLMPAGLLVVWFGGWWLACACALVALLMAYEWASMSDSAPAWALMAGAAITPLAYQLGGWSYAVAAMASGALLVALVGRGKLVAMVGVVLAALAPIMLLALREGPWDGRAAALIFMSTVWASDAGAYFAGRGFGGPALAPRDSPNKTWSGAVGAVLSTILCGLIAAGLLDVAYLPWIIVGALISIVAQVGDLLESQAKRRFGVKDSGSLLPGHGGVLDRVDGLGAVCIVTVTAFLASPGLVRLLGLSG